jgi:hypothetical protein
LSTAPGLFERFNGRRTKSESQEQSSVGTGVICETWAPLEVAVIPAKAGIHSANLRKSVVDGLDSRFRGNDWRFGRDAIPNDTTTLPRALHTTHGKDAPSFQGFHRRAS